MRWNWRAILQSLLGNPAQYLLLDGVADPRFKVKCFDRIKMRGNAGTFDQRTYCKGFSANNLARAVNPKQRRRAAQDIDNRTLGPVPLGQRSAAGSPSALSSSSFTINVWA